jgi:hypothetical protein
MSDNLLEDIEKIVDDFCEKPLEEINNKVEWNELEEISLSPSSTSYSRSSIFDMRYYHQNYIPLMESRMMKDSIKCHCNTEILVYIIRSYEHSHPYDLLESHVYERQNVSSFYCPVCGREWRIVGNLVSLEAEIRGE